MIAKNLLNMPTRNWTDANTEITRVLARNARLIVTPEKKERKSE